MKMLDVTPEELLEKEDIEETLLHYDYIIINVDVDKKIIINTKYINMLESDRGTNILISTVSREIAIFRIRDSIHINTEKITDRITIYPQNE
jgi:hypothetical protein